MSISFVEAYLMRKTNDITKYAKIMLKSVYQAKSDNTETIEKCIDTYFKCFVLGNENTDIQNKDEFCLKNDINDRLQKQMIAIIFNTIPLLQDRIMDSEYEKNIILLSEILASAVKLDQDTNSIVNANINYSESLAKIIHEYKLFNDDKLWNHIKEVKQELKDKVNDNLKITKKVITALKKDPFYLNHYQIYDTPRTAKIFIETCLEFDKSKLQVYDPKRVDEAYLKSNLPTEHTLIMVDKTLVLLMLSRMAGTDYDQIFIRVNENFFKKKSNVKKLLNMTKIGGLKNKISLVVSGVQLEKYADQIKQLSLDNYGIALDDMDYLNGNIGSVRLIAKYLFINAEFIVKRREILPVSEENHITLIDVGVEKEAILIDI